MPIKKQPIKIIKPQQVTDRDPKTGQTVTSLTLGGTIAKLEFKVGEKVTNPFVTRK